MERIDIKYIQNALKNNGIVYIHYRFFDIVTEQVQTKGSGIAKLFSVFKFHKKMQKKEVLVERTESVSKIRSRGNLFKEEIKDIPYDRILSLDKTIYGEGLYIAHRQNEVYDILNDGGVVIGRFDMQGKGHYYPNMNGLLPKEAYFAQDRNQDCDPVRIEEIIADYYAKNPESDLGEINNDLFVRFPDLTKFIKEKVYDKKDKIEKMCADLEKTQEINEDKNREI